MARSADYFADDETKTFEELSDTVKQLSEIVQRRLEESGQYAHDTVQKNPWTTVMVAGAIGALIALSISRRSAPRHSARAWRDYVPSTRIIPQNFSAELPSSQSLARRFEGLIDTISELDPKAVGVPALKTAQEIYATVRDSHRSISK